MNNFIKDYGILRVGLGICGVSLFTCAYQESEEKMSKELKTQWHPAFVSAMKLELIAYACLYKAYENYVDEILLEEITITMVREKKPMKLFGWFEKNGYQIQEAYKGIYYVTRDEQFMTQIIVSGELSKENQKWLTLLSKDLDKADIQRIIAQIGTLTEESEKNYVDSVLQVTMKENKQIFGQLKEEEKMCQALREFFEPELKEAIKGAEENKRKDMILNALKVGSSAEDISRVMGIPLAEVEAIAKEKNVSIVRKIR